MNEKIFNLLVRKISGELTEDEQLIINQLFEKDQNASEEYEKLKHIWEAFDKYERTQDINVLKNKAKKITNSPKTNNSLWKFLAAASVFFLSIFILFTHKKTVQIANNTFERQTYTLPDNSKIILDKNSILEYQIGLFTGFDRKVKISGRAFFDIVHNPQKPFIINCNTLKAKVLGTKFNIMTNKNEVEITLVSGKLLINDFVTRPDTSFVMAPGEIVIYYPLKDKILHKKTNPKIQTFWLSSKIHFEDFTMAEISEIFSEYFNKKLIFTDSLSLKKKIGGSAPSDDYRLILQALSLILHKDYTENGNTITFK